jgi:hypothetical protein
MKLEMLVGTIYHYYKNNTKQKSIISRDYKESKDMNKKSSASTQIIIPL